MVENYIDSFHEMIQTGIYSREVLSFKLFSCDLVLIQGEKSKKPALREKFQFNFRLKVIEVSQGLSEKKNGRMTSHSRKNTNNAVRSFTEEPEVENKHSIEKQFVLTIPSLANIGAA